MRNLTVAFAVIAAVTLGGAFGKAEAVPLASVPAQAGKPIHSAACNGRNANCPPGRHEVCGPAGHCWCAPC